MLKLALAVLVLGSLASCGPARRAPAEPVTPAPPVPAPTVATPPAPPAPPPRAPAEIPAFARPGFDPDTLTQRVSFARASELRETHDGAPLAIARQTSELWVRVLDADVHGTPRRPWVLCQSTNLQVAVFADAASLEQVVVGPTTATPTSADGKLAPNAPGIWLRGGVEVTTGGTRDGKQAITIDDVGAGVTATGWVSPDRVGLMFEYDERDRLSNPKTNHELRANVTVHDGAGVAFATLDSAPNRDARFVRVRRRSGARSLVRCQPHDRLAMRSRYPCLGYLARMAASQGGGGGAWSLGTATATPLRATSVCVSQSQVTLGWFIASATSQASPHSPSDLALAMRQFLPGFGRGATIASRPATRRSASR